MLVCKNLSFIYILILFSPSALFANNIKNSAVVFMYHRFGQQNSPSTNITMEQFKKHLEEFNKDQYNVVPLEYIIDSFNTDTILPDNTIAISIDDGHKSILTNAWPLIKKYNFPITIFISTDPINSKSKNYLSWNDIRFLKNQGVSIGAHTKTHPHLQNLSPEEIKNEIELSNKVYLKELNEIPKLFAYPFGEANDKVFQILKDYGFKASFGQHSGVINETSDFNYLPRFSLNEKYGDIERVKFSSNAKGMGVYDLIPTNPEFNENPPFIGFSLLDKKLANIINCFVYDTNGNVDLDLYSFEERIEIRLNRKLKEGRVRMNCTAKEKENWRWFGHQFIVPKYLN